MPLAVVALAALLVLLCDLLAPKNVARRRDRHRRASARSSPAMLVAQQYGHDYAAFFGAFITGGFTMVFEEIIVARDWLIAHLYGDARAADGSAADRADAVEHLRRDADGRRGQPDDDLPRPGVALARALLSVRWPIAQRARGGAQVLDPLLDGFGFLLFGMALLFGASGSVALAARRPALTAIRSSGSAPACSWSASPSS